MPLHSPPDRPIVLHIVRKVAWLALLSAFVLAACGTVDLPPTTPARTPSTAPTVPPGPPSAGPTPTAVVAGNCPDPQRTTVGGLTGADPTCFHGDIVVIGWIDRPPNIGFDPTPVIPTWLTAPADVQAAVWSVPPKGSDRACPATASECAWMFFHVAPGSEVTVDVTPRWVLLTGHIHDPAAATCNYVWAEIPSDFPFQPASSSADSLIATCDLAFVVTKIEDTTAP